MPYRNAHWWVIGFLPLVAMAFFPGYLATLQTAPMAFHVHGVSATFWMLSLAFQSWSIQTRRRALHRAAGQASLLVFPVLFASFFLIVRQMASETAAGDIFYARFGAALASIDAAAVVGIGLFVFRGVSRRRQVHEHGGWLLATLILLVPPVVGRLPGWTPWLAINGPADFDHFAIAGRIGNAVAVATALVIASRVRVGQPFRAAALLIVIGAVLFETVVRLPSAKALFAGLGAIPPASAFLVGLGVGTALVVVAWRAPLQRPALQPA